MPGLETLHGNNNNKKHSLPIHPLEATQAYPLPGAPPGTQALTSHASLRQLPGQPGSQEPLPAKPSAHQFPQSERPGLQKALAGGRWRPAHAKGGGQDTESWVCAALRRSASFWARGDPLPSCFPGGLQGTRLNHDRFCRQRLPICILRGCSWVTEHPRRWP